MEKEKIENKESHPQSIEGNTQIIFTIKGFIGTMLSVLGVFGSFYFMVFVPRIEKTEEYQKEIFDKTEQYQKEMYNQQLTYISQEFTKINSTINIINNNFEDLTNRFNDLNNIVIQNSGGGFSDANGTIHFMDAYKDENLTDNY